MQSLHPRQVPSTSELDSIHLPTPRAPSVCMSILCSATGHIFQCRDVNAAPLGSVLRMQLCTTFKIK